MVTPYLEATGNTAAVNTVELTARVQGYVQEIKYPDGAAVKKCTLLLGRAPRPTRLRLEQAHAAAEGATPSLINPQAEFPRPQEAHAKRGRSRRSLHRARAIRDPARASVPQAQATT